MNWVTHVVATQRGRAFSLFMGLLSFTFCFYRTLCKKSTTFFGAGRLTNFVPFRRKTSYESLKKKYWYGPSDHKTLLLVDQRAFLSGVTSLHLIIF